MIPILGKVSNIISLRYTYVFDLIWNKKMNGIVRAIPYHRYEMEETYDKVRQLNENNIYLSAVSCASSIVIFAVSTIAYIYILVNISVWLTLSILLLTTVIGYISSYIATKEYEKNYKMSPDFRYGIYKSSLMRLRDYSKDIRLNRAFWNAQVSLYNK